MDCCTEKCACRLDWSHVVTSSENYGKPCTSSINRPVNVYSIHLGVAPNSLAVGLLHYQEEGLSKKSNSSRMKNILSIQSASTKFGNVLTYSHLLAYTISATAPQPHRLASLPFKLQIPSLIPSRIYDSEFLREMRTTETVRLIARIWHRIKTWSRRTFIGDRVELLSMPV